MSLPFAAPAVLVASIVALIFSSSVPPATPAGGEAADYSVEAPFEATPQEAELAATGDQADVVLETPEVKGESV